MVNAEVTKTDWGRSAALKGRQRSVSFSQRRAHEGPPSLHGQEGREGDQEGTVTANTLTLSVPGPGERWLADSSRLTHRMAGRREEGGEWSQTCVRGGI